MPILLWIVASTIFVSLISFVGIIILFLKERILNKILLFLVAFSAGALMGVAFLDLLPEAIEKAGIQNESLIKIFIFLLFGFSVFFILEQFIGWHHHHSASHPEPKPLSYLILVSDAIHNFLDGIIIAGSFMVGIPLGLVTVLAVVLHEIPQEIGDFGVLLYGGIKKLKALFLNFISALSAILGGFLGFLLSEKMGQGMFFFLPFAAGCFIYIAASDLIPYIKEEGSFKKRIINFLIFLAGILLIGVLTTLLA